MIKVGSLFSGGIDGMMMGFISLPEFISEVSIDIDSISTKVLKANYSHQILTQDIRNTSWHEFEE